MSRDCVVTKGLRSKTINVFAKASTTQFKLQNNNELGLPKDAIIVALQCRTPSTDGRVNNGQAMIAEAVFDKAYLNLKYRKISDNKIDHVMENYYLPRLVTDALFFLPVASCRIDWNQSFIQIKRDAQADVVPGTYFEFVVHYITAEAPSELENRFCFRTGFERLGIQVKHIELALDPAQNIVKISNTENVGLPLDGCLVGFSTSQPDFPLTGDKQSDASLKRTFLTLKKGTLAFIDAYPVEISNYKDTLFPEIDYFPIEPIWVNQIDWNQSFIQIFDTTSITDAMKFSLDLYFVQPNP